MHDVVYNSEYLVVCARIRTFAANYFIMKKFIAFGIILFVSRFLGIAQTEKSFADYSKFDFIRGEKIVYYNDFTHDTLNKFPANWLSNSPGQIEKLNEYSGNWFRLNLGSTTSTDGVLLFGTNTTIEFDMIANVGKKAKNDNSEIQVYFHSQKRDETLGDYVPGNGGFSFRFIGESVSVFNWKNGDFSTTNYEVPTDELAKNLNKKVHISIAIKKDTVRLYINQFKVIDLPNVLPEGVPPMDRISFFCNGINSNFSLLISNLSVETGIADNAAKMKKLGKFATNAVTFIPGSDTITSESYTAIKDIAFVINDTHDTKFKIVGYTDNDGSETANLTLSKKRADAIMKVLVEVFEVNKDIITAEGKGQASPLNNNTTNEEKAINNRFEIIKL